MSRTFRLGALLGLAAAALVAVTALATPTAAVAAETNGWTTSSQYAAAMRERSQWAVSAVDDGWKWTERGVASLLGGKTSNAYFTWVNNGLSIKPGVKPSEALKHVFYNRDQYGFDCATAAILMLQAGRLQTLGSKDFDRLYPNNTFRIAGWKDRVTAGKFSTKFNTRRYTQSGVKKINGRWNLAGENMPFDPSKGDKLMKGAVYYFEIFGDDKTGNQGWNVVYMGPDGNGNHLFFRSPGGVATIRLDPNNNYSDVSGVFPGGFLSANITQPDGALLLKQDTDKSSAW